MLTSPDETPGPPVYASLARAPFLPLEIVQTDGQWVAIDFVREPVCIPPDFNLLFFLDIPDAFDCSLSVDIKESSHSEDLAIAGPWEASPPFTPFEARFTGDAVPVYFVLRSELDAETADGVSTIDELEGFTSLHRPRRHVCLHTAQLEPGEAIGPFVDRRSSIVAHGVLEDGGRFQFHIAERNNVPHTVRIVFK